MENERADTRDGDYTDTADSQISLPTSIWNNVPLDIFLNIAESLPKSSRLALSYTCHCFSELINVTAKGLLEYPSQEIVSQRPLWNNAIENHDPAHKKRRELQAERLELMCLLDKDRGFALPVCSECVSTHVTSAYTEDQLREAASKRKCIGSSGKLWVDPNIILGFAAANTICHASLHAFPRRSVSGGIKVTIFHSQTHPTVGFKTVIPLAWFEDACQLRLSNLRDTVANINLPVCGHLNLQDQEILSQFDADFLSSRLDPNDNGDYDYQAPFLCLTCRAQVIFDTSSTHVETGWGTFTVCRLNLTILRACEPGMKITEPRWTCALTPPTQFAALKRQWRKVSQDAMLVVAELDVFLECLRGIDRLPPHKQLKYLDTMVPNTRETFSRMMRRRHGQQWQDLLRDR